MQTSDQNPQENEVPGTSNFNAVLHHQAMYDAAAHHQTQFRQVIEDFFACSGVSGPTSAIHDMLHDFLIKDNDGDDLTNQQYINRTVIEANRITQFLAALYERWLTLEKYLPQPNLGQQAA